MNLTLVSILVLIAVSAKPTKAQDIRNDINGAPVFAELNIDGITRNMTLINPHINSITSASVTFNKKNLQLDLSRKIICPPNRMCAMVMPAPVQISLPIVKIENTKCSVKYTAMSSSIDKYGLRERVVLEDFETASCPMASAYLFRAGIVTYQAKGVSALTHKIETATISFSVRDFVRALN